MRSEVVKQLMSADWGEIGKKLLAFAEWRASHYRWRSGNIKELAQGMTPEDIVQEVIIKTINGERKWDPDLGPLEPWLKDQVKSIMDAIFKSAANRREVRSLEDPDDAESSLERIAHKHNVIAPFATEKPPNPDEQLSMAERVSELFSAVSGDHELEEVLEAIMDGCEPKPQYLAQELGISVEEINNRIKRLRRRALKLERD